MGVTKKNGKSLRTKLRSKSLHGVSRSMTKDDKIVKKVHNKIEAKLVKSLTQEGKPDVPTDGHNVLDSNDPNYKNFTNVSKSSIRRRKRKLRDALKPKMDDMLDTLNEIGGHDKTSTIATTTSITGPGKNTKYEYLETKNKHIPNPHKSKGKAFVETAERKNFNGTLANGSFRNSPFATLKDRIANNLNTIG
ncbi:Slx9 protein [Saccharomycopsis crataegensis]|uniref:Ribosome biogenesis protein SLX9 n=1 Tax=Saccharomycopsis crataegensis TaxID=43959 RepID=A0AAV5QG62_9ASCO|nr:Slx9 protein [Saccharomycopsis crataegensis]